MAIAKRRAIQSLMRNKTLTPAERHTKMQDIMKGNFAMEESDGDSDNDDDNSSQPSEGSHSSESKSFISSEDSSSKDDDDGSVSTNDDSKDDDDGSLSLSGVNSQSTRDSYSTRDAADNDNDDMSAASGSESSSSQYSGSHQSSQFGNSVQTEDDSKATTGTGRSGSRASHSSRVSNASSVSKGGGGSKQQQQQQQQQQMSSETAAPARQSSSSSADNKGSRANYASKRDSTSSTRSIGSIGSTKSNSGNNKSMANKDKQKALLEISRDKSLSAKERQAKMKEIMQTPVQGTFSRSESNMSNLSNNNNENDDQPTELTDQEQQRRPSRRQSRLKDSIKECTVSETEGVQPIRMSRRRINIDINEMKDVIERIQNNDPTLTKVEFQKMNLTDENVIPLLDALGKNTTVTTLDLRRNRIGIEGSSTLASAILDNTTLVKVDISGNNLGDEGLEDLSKVIPYNKSLKTLNIEDNKVGDAGATSFAEALIENTGLTYVNLSGNVIGDAGAIDLFKVLSSANTTVETLLLRFNAISDGGATELASTLLDNETLKVVDLGHNKITNKGGTDLLKVVGINDTLEELELGGNVGIDEDMLEEIKDTLEEEGGSSSEEEESGSESGSDGEGESGSESGSDGSESENGGGNDDGAAAGEPHGGEAMLEDMPDETNAALAKRKAIQSVMQDKSLSGVERNKKIQDIMAGKVELPKVEPKKEKAKPKPPVASESGSDKEEEKEGGSGELNGGEAMLTDMPDETNAALAKRKAIQSVMQDKSLSGVERNKKIQDIMAGKVELPKVEAKKPPAAESESESQSESEYESESESEYSSSEGSESSQSVDTLGDPVVKSDDEGSVDTLGDPVTNNDEPHGGEAMLEDMPDETDTALAKRMAIQSVMKDKSLTPVERNKKMQDIMSGKTELPKVEKKQKAKSKSKPKAVAVVAAAAASDDDSVDTLGDPVVKDDAVGEPHGGEAMLEDMPDETDIALRKRQAIQSVMQDKSLSGVERNKKIQDIMAGKVELPKVVPKKDEKPADKSGRRGAPPSKQEESDSESEYSGSESESSQSVDTLGDPVVKSDGEESVDTLGDHVNQNDEPKAELSKVEPPKESLTKSKSDRKGKDQKKEANSPNKSKGPAKHVAIKDSSSSADTAKGKEVNNALRRLPSNDGGMRSYIAHEWKERMMTVHPRSHDNLLDILLAHQYRLSLQTPPGQSFFRVVAVVFFSRVVDGKRRDERYHVVGTNDEPHSLAGSICAERAALMQLRFIPDLEEITKVVIVTDHVDAISPGMLCREFMASHNKIPWNVPIVLGRSVCRKCGFTVSGKVCSDFNGCFNEADNDVLRDANSNMFATCSKGHEESKNKQYDTPHDFVGTVTTLRDLFPYPSLYTRLTSNEAMKFGEDYLQGSTMGNGKSKEANIRAEIENGNKRFNEDTSPSPVGSFRQERFDLAMLTDIMEEGEEEDGSAGESQKQNGSLKSSATSLRKNGQGSFTSIGQKDSFTSISTNGRKTSSSVKSSMTHSLKTTIDFMKLVNEDREMNSSLTNLTDLPGTLDHLTARTLRISSRLKPSQRREKLMRLATEVTAMESHRAHAHPIRYGSAVLFSDGTVAIASQKVALEYGCTLDAVGQLASTIDRKAIQIIEDSPPCRPILLVQCDQFGVAHAPFAQGRAYLTERGYGDCKVLIHQQKKEKTLQETSIEEEDSIDNDVSVTGDGMNVVEATKMKLRLLEVEANDLAPAPPDMFGGLITKNHSQQEDGGLQIQF